MRSYALVTVGDLRETLGLKRRTVTKNSFGSDVVTYAEPLDFRGQVTGPASRPSESWDSSLRSIRGNLQLEILLHYREDIRIGDRIVWGERELNVEAYTDPEAGRRRWLLLGVSEVQK